MDIKQSIKYLKLKMKKDNSIIQGMYGDIYDEIRKDNKAIKTLIIAYDKQQKEIERYRKLRADIIKVNKKIYDVDIIEDMCEQLANSISKDKIKEKIEELEKPTQEGQCLNVIQGYVREGNLILLKELLGE